MLSTKGEASFQTDECVSFFHLVSNNIFDGLEMTAVPHILFPDAIRSHFREPARKPFNISCFANVKMAMPSIHAPNLDVKRVIIPLLTKTAICILMPGGSIKQTHRALKGQPIQQRKTQKRGRESRENEGERRTLYSTK